MFCMNCGKQLPDGAKFCRYCGTPQADDSSIEAAPSIVNINQSTKLVPGNCTNCGASVQVDPDQQAAICPACGTPYIIQKAINNFNVNNTGNMSVENAVINVAGVSADNHIKRAIEFEKSGELEKALEYYNKALDAEPSNLDATASVNRISALLKDFVYKSTYAEVFSSGKLILKKNQLLFVTTKGKVTTYDLSLIAGISIPPSFGKPTVVDIIYGGRQTSYSVPDGQNWAMTIRNAIAGNYPPITLDLITQQEAYPTYHKSFTEFLDRKAEAQGKTYTVTLTNAGSQYMMVVKMHKDLTSCRLGEAKAFVDNLPAVLGVVATKPEAEKLARKYTSLGATVEIK